RFPRGLRLGRLRCADQRPIVIGEKAAPVCGRIVRRGAVFVVLLSRGAMYRLLRRLLPAALRDAGGESVAESFERQPVGEPGGDDGSLDWRDRRSRPAGPSKSVD